MDPTALTITQFVNGKTRLVHVVTADKFNFPSGQAWVLGANPSYNSAFMRLCDWTIGHGAGTGFRLPTIADIWRDYYECTPGNPTLPGVTAYYPMHEGAGGTVADYMGGTSGTITGAAWVAGFAMPGG